MAKKQEAQAAEQPKKKKQQNEEQLAGFSAPARLREKYKNEVIPYLIEKFGYKNVMEVPKLEKIVLNMGLGADKDNPKESKPQLTSLR